MLTLTLKVFHIFSTHSAIDKAIHRLKYVSLKINSSRSELPNTFGFLLNRKLLIAEAPLDLIL